MRMIAAKAITALASIVIISAIVTGAAAAPLSPASSETTNEITLRLVADEPAADGSVRGALVLELADGWHTYWRDPGASGIPPTLDFSATPGLASTKIGFPPPIRFGEDLTRGNGYDADVSLALTFRPKPHETIGTLDGKIFLGVCRDICIPVQAELVVEPSRSSHTTVEAAFAALPATDEHLGTIEAAGLTPDGKRLSVVARTANPVKTPDLFVTGPSGWDFGEPTRHRVRNDGAVVFDVAIVGRPASAGKNGAPDKIRALFTDGRHAFEGSVEVEREPSRQAADTRAGAAE